MAVDNGVVANYGLTIGFLSAIVTSVVRQFFDARAAAKRWERDRQDRAQQHEWEREARLEAARKVAEHAEVDSTLLREHDVWEREERVQAQAQAEQVATRLAESRALIVQAIDHAKEAYREANDVNRKLERLGLAGAVTLDEEKGG